MKISEISKQINDNAQKKGFWEPGTNLSEKLMLIVSEIAEAQEADRADRYYDPATRYRKGKDLTPNGSRWAFDVVDENPEAWLNWFGSEVKNTFEDELADAAIRIFDLAHQKGINLEWHILQKMRYNEQRPFKHGKKY